MKRNSFNSERMNVLFVISFDMLYPALCCYKLKLSSYELSGAVTINDRVDREGAKKKLNLQAAINIVVPQSCKLCSSCFSNRYDAENNQTGYEFQAFLSQNKVHSEREKISRNCTCLCLCMRVLLCSVLARILCSRSSLKESRKKTFFGMRKVTFSYCNCRQV